MIENLIMQFDVMTIVYIVIAALALMFMITIHELGHYTAGKLLGFKINEFAIGMGPKIFSKRIKKKKKAKNENETDNTDNADEDGEVFSIRAIPLGGFCAFEGEDEAASTANSFNSHKPWKRLIVLFSGAFFNILSAVVISFFVFLCYGDHLPTVMKVYETSPNYINNTIKEGDVIYSVNGNVIYLYNDALTIIAEAGNELDMVVIRDGEKVQLNGVVKDEYTYEAAEVDENGNPMLDENGNPIMKEYTTVGLGVGLNSPAPTRFSFFESIGRSFAYTGRSSVYILQTFGQMITGKISLDQIGGPITTIDVTVQAVSNNFMNIFFIVMLISVNLAVFNLLPIPALDGSRMVFVLIEWIFGKPVISRKVEGIIHFVGMLLLFGFMILVEVLRYT